MEHRQRGISAKQYPVISPEYFGVSFSLKQCRNFTIQPTDCLEFLINQGFRRFRLMSYWDEHEQEAGVYSFAQLDRQIDQINEAGGVITLCLGVRQPRWPETHWPKWSLTVPQTERYEALHRYILTVVERYKNYSCIISWQLENEALNRGFGKSGDFNRRRLRSEYELIHSADNTRPIIMSTSNTWGIPVRKPRPALFGFTFYQTQFEDGAYSHNKLPVSWWRLRARVIHYITRRPSFVHELQAEPWGPKAIWEMSNNEQSKSMSTGQLQANLKLATETKLYPIDLWGGEWWYWRWLQGDESVIEAVRQQLTKL